MISRQTVFCINELPRPISIECSELIDEVNVFSVAINPLFYCPSTERSGFRLCGIDEHAWAFVNSERFDIKPGTDKE